MRVTIEIIYQLVECGIVRGETTDRDEAEAIVVDCNQFGSELEIIERYNEVPVLPA